MSAKTESEERTEAVGARVTPELQRRIRMAAAQENKNVSQWLRDTLDEITEDVQ